MPKYVLHIVSCLVTLALIACGIQYLGFILRPVDTDSAFQQIESFYQVPENSLDLIIYGSSHAYKSIISNKLKKACGLNVYNYGMNWQGISTEKLFLKDSLLTQHPRLALIETYMVYKVLEDTDITAEIFYTRYLRVNKKAYLKKCFGNDLSRYLSYYVPMIQFHENWNSLTKESFTPLRSKGKFLKTMGYNGADKAKAVKLYHPEIEEKAFSESVIEELDDIVQICAENNIEILFFTVPYSTKTGYEYGAAMKKYADEKGCGYLNMFDYMDEIDLKGKTDFRNGGHLNDSGAEKVTQFLAKYINEHYDFNTERWQT